MNIDLSFICCTVSLNFFKLIFVGAIEGRRKSGERS